VGINGRHRLAYRSCWIYVLQEGDANSPEAMERLDRCLAGPNIPSIILFILSILSK
jgi:hypothetical protein